jgi:hypothetical protein
VTVADTTPAGTSSPSRPPSVEGGAEVALVVEGGDAGAGVGAEAGRREVVPAEQARRRRQRQCPHLSTLAMGYHLRVINLMIGTTLD